MIGAMWATRKAYAFGIKQTVRGYKKYKNAIKRNAYTYGYKRGLKRRYSKKA